MTPSKPYLSLELARLTSQEATAAAQKEGLRLIVAVVDEGGHLILLERMDNGAYGSIDQSISNARHAIAHQDRLTSGPWKGAACIEAHGCAIGAISIMAAGPRAAANKSNDMEAKLQQLMQHVLSKIDLWLTQRAAA